MTAASTIDGVGSAVGRARDRAIGVLHAHEREIRIGAAAIGTMIVAIRILGASWRGGFPPAFPDSSSYFDVARLGPFRLSFWFGERPVIVPALYWLLGRDVRLIVLMQVAVYLAVAWWAIVATWRRCRTSAARWLAVVLLAGLAIQSRFALWSTAILSESVSISLGVAALLGWLAFADRGGAHRCRNAFVLTALWALCRDSNVPIALLSTVPASLVLARRPGVLPGTRRALLRGAAIMVVVLGYVWIAGSASDRTIYPTLNVIGQRVLVDPQLTDWYGDWGMPTDPTVMARAGQSSFDHDFDVLLAPDLEPLRAWADDRGQLVQVWSMVRFAPDFVHDVWADLGAELRTDQRSYDTFQVSERLPDRLPLGLDGPRSKGELGVWLGAAVVGLALTAWWRRRAVAVVLSIALVGAALDLYMSWLGDSVEVQRHLVGAVARLTLVLALSIVHGVDAAATRARRARRRAT